MFIRNVKKLMMLSLVVCMLFSMLSLIGVEKVYACSCVMKSTYAEDLEKKSHVFDATVVDKTDHDQSTLDVELAVSAIWKGEAERETHVLTAPYSDACGYEFNIGTRYAVFASEIDGALHVSFCSATTPIADMSSIFTELGQPEKLSDKQLEDPPSDENKDTDQLAAPEASDGPTATTSEGNDALSPDHIEKTITEEELVDRIDTQHTGLVMIFLVVGVLFILGAVFLLLIRRKR